MAQFLCLGVGFVSLNLVNLLQAQEAPMLKYRVVFYVAAIVFAVLVNANIDPQQADAVTQQLTNAEAGVSQLN